MAVNGGNFNEDEFDDLEPVLDEDSFSFDLETPELDEVGLDSMVASAGEEYPEESESSDDVNLDLDSDLSVMDLEPNSEDTFSSADIEDSIEFDDASGFSNDDTSFDDTSDFEDSAPDFDDGGNSDSDFDLNLDMDLDLELDDEDPGIDKKIEEIVNEEKSNTTSDDTKSEEDDFDFDDLSDEDEPITLSLDELENITNTIDPENIENVENFDNDESESLSDPNATTQENEKVVDDLDFDVAGFDDDSDDSKEVNDSTENSDSNFSDEELDEILGTDLFEAEEDLSDEPIALSMDEMENILADEEETESEVSELDPTSLDLDMDTPPDEGSVTDEIEFESLEETAPSEIPELDESLESDELAVESTEDFDPMESDSLFDDDDIADEPITLSMDELSAITGEGDEPEEISEFQEETAVDEEDNLEDSDDFAETFESKDAPMGDSGTDDFDFDLTEESGFGIDDSDASDFKSEPEAVDSFSEDSFSELPEPDDTVDFEEFTLSDEDITAEDTKLLSDPEEDKIEEDNKVFSEATDLSDPSDFSDPLELSDEEDENLTLSDEELGNILGADDELPASDLFDSEDEISLLPEEDEHNLEDSEFSVEESEHSLEEDEETTEDDHSDLDSGVVSDLNELDSLDEDLSDEPITLSSEELNDIIGELPPGEDLETMDQVFEEEIIEPEEDLGFDEEKTPSLDLNAESEPELIDLDEFANEGELSPLEELRSAPKEDPVPTAAIDNNEKEQPSEGESRSGDDLSPEDKKKVLTYLDNLLGNLPDDLIKEFSKSNYFDLYKKMMKEIGL